MHAVLDRLGLGDRHEAHADGCVLVGPDDDIVLPLGQDRPAQRLRPEPGQAGKIVSVNDDVVELGGHVICSAVSVSGGLGLAEQNRGICSAWRACETAPGLG
jgi:hypothetical protein